MNRRFLFILLFVSLFASNGHAQMYTVDKIYLPATGMEVGFHVDLDKPKYAYYDIKNDNSSQEAMARIDLSYVKFFISSLQNSKAKFEEWAKVAKKEKAITISKRIPQRFMDQTIYFTDDGKWFRENGVNMKSLLFVDDYGECFFVLQSDDMQSEELVGESSSLGGYKGGIFGSTTQVTVKHYCKGASLTFKSGDEIDNFIQKLENVLEWKKKNKSQKKLFK